jgi:photosystem II stability/assembly factor-like uncharacterized protein
MKVSAAWALGRAGLLAAILAAAAGPAFAGWMPAGPNSGRFYVLAAPSSRTTIYASSSTGAFWSSLDGGQTWKLAGTLPGGHGYLVAVDPVQANTVYAGDGRDLYKSTDGAVTWTFLTGAVSSAVIAPSAPQTMYSLTGAGVGAPIGVLRSADGGATWQQAGTLPVIFSQNGVSLAVSPVDAETVYVWGQGGFLASADGGVTWGEAFSPQTNVDVALAVVVSPLAPQTLWLNLSRPASESGGRVYRSDDGGATWSEADQGLPQGVGYLVVAPSGTLYASGGANPSTLTVSIFSSADRGASWQEDASLLLNGVLTTAAGTPDLLFLAGIQGLQISQNEGKTWTSPAQPPSAAAIDQVLAGPPAGGNLLYAVESTDGISQPPYSGLWESRDGGAGWSPLQPNDQFSPQLALDAQPGVLYSFSSALAPFVPTVSRDDGATWEPLPQPTSTSPPALQPLALATDPLLPGKLVELECGVVGSIFTGFSCTRFAVELTNTGGRGWRQLGTLPHAAGDGTSFPLVRFASGHAASPYLVLGDSLFALSSQGQGFEALPLRGPIVDLAVVPGIGAGPADLPTLFAAVSRPRVLWRSLDGGAHWSPASLGLPSGLLPVALAVDPDDPATLYLATQHQIFVSHDSAESWQPIATDGIAAVFPFSALAVTRNPGKAIFAGTNGGGLFVLALQ